MSGAIKRRLLSLERNIQVERAALMKELQYDIFEVMHFSHEDEDLLDAIAAHGEASTPEEDAFLQRFSAEYEVAFKLVRSRKRVSNLERNC